VRLLTTDDPLEAAAIAAELDHHNEERRAIEAGVLEGRRGRCRASGQPRGDRRGGGRLASRA
jgi:single-stranded-DNA-specific exonuclease